MKSQGSIFSFSNSINFFFFNLSTKNRGIIYTYRVILVFLSNLHGEKLKGCKQGNHGPWIHLTKGCKPIRITTHTFNNKAGKRESDPFFDKLQISWDRSSIIMPDKSIIWVCGPSMQEGRRKTASILGGNRMHLGSVCQNYLIS